MTSFTKFTRKTERATHFKQGAFECYSNGQVLFYCFKDDVGWEGVEKEEIEEIVENEMSVFRPEKAREFIEKFEKDFESGKRELNSYEQSLVKMGLKGVGKGSSKSGHNDVVLFYNHNAVLVSDKGEEKECRCEIDFESVKDSDCVRFGGVIAIALHYLQWLGDSVMVVPGLKLSRVTFDYGKGKEKRRWFGFISNMKLDSEQIESVKRGREVIENV